MFCLSGNYHSVKKGNVCQRITTKEECEAAANFLGLPDTNASVPSDQSTRKPLYCYYKPYKPGSQRHAQLWFNDAMDSGAPCSAERYCLCKLGKASYYHAIQASEQTSNLVAGPLLE